MPSLGAVVGTVFHYVGHIAITTAAAVLIYVCAKIAKKLFKAYQEIFVMWTIAFGRRWMPETKSLRIQPYFCRTSELDEVSIQECFQFHSEAFYAADDIPQDRLLMLYRDVMLSYSHILFCRDRLDGSLRGLVFFGLEHNSTYTVLKVGLMLIHRNYRGGPWMRLAGICMIMRELILHPRTPLFMIAKLSTYKAYLMASQVPEAFPRYDGETPELYKKIAEEFVKSIKVPTDSYNRDTLVLRRRVGIVREHLVAISERDLANPHIRFFNDHNPGWRKGDQLVTLVKMTWGIFLRFIVIAARQLRQSPSGDNVPKGLSSAGTTNRRKASKLKSRLMRGMSYQDREAIIYSTRLCTYSLGEDEGVFDVTKRSEGARSDPVDRLYSHSEDEELNVDFNF